MSHFKEVCVCGRVLAQCRCIGEKTVKIVSPCKHDEQLMQAMDAYTHSMHSATTATQQVEPITWEMLYNAHTLIMAQHGQPPARFRCDPIFYKRLQDWAADQAAEQIKNNPKYKLEGEIDATPFKRVFGVTIKVDRMMKENSWRFEDIFGDEYNDKVRNV